MRVPLKSDSLSIQSKPTNKRHRTTGNNLSRQKMNGRTEMGNGDEFMEGLRRGETGNGRDDVTSCFTHFCQEIALPFVLYSRAPTICTQDANENVYTDQIILFINRHHNAGACLAPWTRTTYNLRHRDLGSIPERHNTRVGQLWLFLYIPVGVFLFYYSVRTKIKSCNLNQWVCRLNREFHSSFKRLIYFILNSANISYANRTVLLTITNYEPGASYDNCFTCT